MTPRLVPRWWSSFVSVLPVLGDVDGAAPITAFDDPAEQLVGLIDAFRIGPRS